MNNSLTCPNCDHEIEISAVLRAQLTSQIRGELDAEARRLREQYDEQQKQLKLEKEQLADSQRSVAEQIEAGIDAQRGRLLSDAKKQAAASLAIELKDRDAQLTELRANLNVAQSKELELRREHRQLESQKNELELQVSRQIDQERDKIRSEAKRRFDEEYALKAADKDKKIQDLADKLKEMQRRVEQGSQQLQGEVQELALEQMLCNAFLSDDIEPIAKGVHGGDCFHLVNNRSGVTCGRILWESKRTRRWGGDWLAKARDDARESRSDSVVIVSQTLPEGVKDFALIDDVWVCSWPAAQALATALRYGLIEVSKAQLATQGQKEKHEQVYQYLASNVFRQRVGGIVEAFVTMQTDLESEKRSAKRQWAKREKQIERAVTNTAVLYGDLQGIVGASLQGIDGLQSNACLEDQSGDRNKYPKAG